MEAVGKMERWECRLVDVIGGGTRVVDRGPRSGVHAVGRTGCALVAFALLMLAGLEAIGELVQGRLSKMSEHDS